MMLTLAKTLSSRYLISAPRVLLSTSSRSLRRVELVKVRERLLVGATRAPVRLQLVFPQASVPNHVALQELQQAVVAPVVVHHHERHRVRAADASELQQREHLEYLVQGAHAPREREERRGSSGVFLTPASTRPCFLAEKNDVVR